MSCAGPRARQVVPRVRAARPCGRASRPGSARAPRASRRRRASGDSVRAVAATSTSNRFASTEPSAVTFIGPKPGSAPIRFFRSVPSAASLPDPRGVATVILAHDGCEVAHPLGHRAREAVDRGALGEERCEVELRELLRVERAGPLLQHVAARRTPSAPAPAGRSRSRPAARTDRRRAACTRPGRR